MTGHPDQAIHQMIEWLRDLYRVGAVVTREGKSQEAVPALAEALKDDSVPVRKMAALMLGELGPDARPAVPALVAALHDSNDDVRRRVALALGEIGGAARAAVPALLAAMQDRNEGVRKMAAWALGEVASPTGRSQAA